MIDQAEISAVKQDVDLIGVIRSRGVTLRKKGKGYQGICPFHDDTDPSLSVNPSQNLWNCFGCSAGGDAVRFVEMFDNVEFPEAVKRLGGNTHAPESSQPKAVNKKNPPPTPALQPPTPKALKLLKRVTDFYHTALTKNPQAMEYLEQRGIKNKALLGNYCIGFADGSLLKVLPDDGETTDQLKQLGILNPKGREHFYGCVTFPLYGMDGNPEGMYGRRITDSKGSASHLYLPGPRQGIFNRQAVKQSNEIILTESVIDALTLIDAGLSNTIPCYGTNGLSPSHLTLLKENRPRRILICFDGDDAGRKGAEGVRQRLEQEDISTSVVSLPEGRDLNEFFLLTADPLDRFQELLLEPATRQEPETAVKEEAVKEKKEEMTPTESGFTLTVTGRRYDVRGITKGKNKLKATVKGLLGKRFHVDTVDFYSARSRLYLIQGLARLFGVEESVVTRDLERLTHLAEEYHPDQAKPTETKEMTAQERKQALSFLKNPDLLDEILQDLETMGYTGEETNKLLCYLAAVSRKMASPLSVMIQSRSAAGKSSLQDALLSLVPEEECVKYTRLTDQSLFYMDSESLVHKILAIEELDGMHGAIYSIRCIQSSGKLTVAYTGKDPVSGELKTLTNTVQGPLTVFITTTKVDIDGETASRFVFLSIDESEAMTRKILAKQRTSRTLEGMLDKLQSDGIIQKHQNANRLLKPLRVLNPYAELLTFTSRSIRARRDHNKYLNLMEAIAFLFQHQREIRTVKFQGETIEYIDVTLEDIDKANTIADEVLGRCLDELTPPSRRLLKLIREMVMQQCREQETPPESFLFTRRDIREFSAWSDFQVKTHIKQLEELEYIYPAVGRKGKEYVYELIAAQEELPEDTPFLMGLTQIGQLKKKVEEMEAQKRANAKGSRKPGGGKS